MYRPRHATVTTLLGLVLSLALAQHGAAQQLVLTPFKPSGIYALGEKAGWSVALPSGAAMPAEYSYVIRKNNFDLIKSGQARPFTARDYRGGAERAGNALRRGQIQ